MLESPTVRRPRYGAATAVPQTSWALHTASHAPHSGFSAGSGCHTLPPTLQAPCTVSTLPPAPTPAPQRPPRPGYQPPASSASAPPTPYLPYARFRSQKASTSAIGQFTSRSRMVVERVAGEVAGESSELAAGAGTGVAGPGFTSKHWFPRTWWPGRLGPLPRDVDN